MIQSKYPLPRRKSKCTQHRCERLEIYEKLIIKRHSATLVGIGCHSPALARRCVEPASHAKYKKGQLTHTHSHQQQKITKCASTTARSNRQSNKSQEKQQRQTVRVRVEGTNCNNKKKLNGKNSDDASQGDRARRRSRIYVYEFMFLLCALDCWYCWWCSSDMCASLTLTYPSSAVLANNQTHSTIQFRILHAVVRSVLICPTHSHE